MTRPAADRVGTRCGNLPTTATALIAPEGDIGTQSGFGGDCAGTGTPPCRLSMDHNRVATIIFNGSG